MIMVYLHAIILLICFVSSVTSQTIPEQKSPNIVFVLFDDLGWQDLSINGGEIPTPNMDSLFTESINLKKHYIHLICSISRSQFLTGRYSMYNGYGRMSPFGVGHIGGIPIGQPTLPQWLKSYNNKYSTYGVGKWVMGYSTKSQLPLKRGFDHFFGTYTAAIDYSNGKISANKCDGCNPDRYDLHDDGQDYEMKYENTIYDFRDKMIEYTDIEIQKNVNNDFSSPFYMYFPIQTPHGPLTHISEYVKTCVKVIGDMENVDESIRTHRLKYCEAIVASDDIIGTIINKLKKYSQIWDNTLFILTTDNGGDLTNTGCNYPYRGTKGTWFEGNERSIALIGGGLIPESQRGTIRESLFSALDWTPTLLDFVGIYDKIINNNNDITWDGINQYKLLMYGDDYTDRNDRDHIVFNIANRDLKEATVVFKYPNDDNKLYKYLAQAKPMTLRTDGWCKPDEETGSWSIIEDDLELQPDLAPETQAVDNKYIFNLDDDESELNNLLVSDPDSEKTQHLKEYAFNIFDKYMEHELFSEPFRHLWSYDQEEDDDPIVNENGKEYLHPWLSEDEYLSLINTMILRENKNGNIISDKLTALYNEEWKSPFDRKDKLKAAVKEEDEYVSVPSSCVGLADGEYIMKLIDEDGYPLVKVQCSNEYMLVNIKKDASWTEYFTSWAQWHYDIAGPDKNDPVNYNNWFIPAPKVSPEEEPCPIAIRGYTNWRDVGKEVYTDPVYPTKYVISPQCSVCDEDNHILQQYQDKTTYNMNGAGYGLFFGLRRPACDFDWDSLQCKVCDHSEGSMVGSSRPNDLTIEDTAQNDRVLPNTMFGVCLTETRSAFQCSTADFSEFTGYWTSNYKPTIGINGRFCQCIKIDEQQPEYVQVSQHEYDAKLAELAAAQVEAEQIENEKNVEKKKEDNIVYLYQRDFEFGTYRITESGIYNIMEDIEFNFNSPPIDIENDINFSPNSVEHDYWWPPNTEYINSKYPGAGYKAREQYQLGYFAGITIETSNVELNLNGYTIKQSIKYSYQQPFFANIALTSQPFLPNQGPGFYGADPHFASNVIIKNGIIGHSSHHGIQGAKNKNIKIENIKIIHFMTHGIQFNGFDNLHLENVDIGPTSNQNYLNHNYAHLRMLLPYLNKMANYDQDHIDKTISFDIRGKDKNHYHDGTKYTLNDLIDIAIEKLDKVYKYVTNNNFDPNCNEFKNLINNDEDFKLFINPDGLPYGAVVYGMYLNYPGSGIFGWDVSDLRPNNLYMKNIKIHDLYHSGNEIFALSKNKKRFVVNTLLAPLNMEHLLGDVDTLKEWIHESYFADENVNEHFQPHYVGNIATDIYFAMYKFGSDRYDEWWLGTPYIGLKERLSDWVEGNDDGAFSSALGETYWEPVCAMDGMSHPGKGLVGIKLTNTDNVVIDGSLEIYNLFDKTPLSEAGDICVTISNTYGREQATKVTSSEQWPYQTAFSMNQIFAFSMELSDIKIKENTDIIINNLQSLTGRVLGLISWYSTKVQFEGENINVNINDLFAGVDVERGQFKYYDSPNHKPETCAIANFDGPTLSPDIELYEDTEINQYCIHGHTGCWGDEEFTNVGIIDNDEQKCETKMYEYYVMSSSKYDQVMQILDYDQMMTMLATICFVVTLLCCFIIYHKSTKEQFEYEQLE